MVFLLALCFVLSIASSCSDTAGQSCDVCLSSSNFLTGTFRIRKSGKYCLTENILFNPNGGNIANPNAEGAWFPTDNTLYPGSANLRGGPFSLGFFTVISIEASHVVVDLVGHKISFHPHFYIQQRFASIIEIANAPFLPGHNFNDFGDTFTNVDDIEICHGTLGLSSHHGIHANNASNLVIHDLDILNYEVAGIQLNGFDKAELYNLNIGPSSAQVPVYTQYLYARFVVQAFHRMLKEKDENTVVQFGFGTRTLRQVYVRLLTMMDIAFRSAVNESTPEDLAHPLFREARSMFIIGCSEFPSGGALYGIILNSFSFSGEGFGDSSNKGNRQGGQVTMTNVGIRDLKLKVDDVPAMYIKDTPKCGGDGEVSRGPFGDVLDIKVMIDKTQEKWVNHYDYELDLYPFADEMKYVGNPLTDAEIALYQNGWGYNMYMHDGFVKWTKGDAWPTQCVEFVCNGDRMFHTNKGVVGIRMDGIEKAVLTDITIERLVNRSPLATNACKDFNAVHDGGSASFVDEQGAMDADMRGISVVDGDVIIKGTNMIQRLNSLYGDCIGIDVMVDASVEFASGSVTRLKNFNAASSITVDQYKELKKEGKVPQPYNFDVCTIKAVDKSQVIGFRTDVINDCTDAGASERVIDVLNYEGGALYHDILMFAGLGAGVLVYMVVCGKERNKDAQYTSIE